MSLYSDEEFRFGASYEFCPSCKEAISGRCDVHRRLEATRLSPPENVDDPAAGYPEDDADDDDDD